MDKTFMCDIITGYKEENMDLEQLLIKAKSLTGAFEKLIDARNYINVFIYEQRGDGLFAQVETEGVMSPILHVLIGEPTVIIE